MDGESIENASFHPAGVGRRAANVFFLLPLVHIALFLAGLNNDARRMPCLPCLLWLYYMPCICMWSLPHIGPLYEPMGAKKVKERRRKKKAANKRARPIDTLARNTPENSSRPSSSTTPNSVQRAASMRCALVLNMDTWKKSEQQQQQQGEHIKKAT